MYNNSSIDVQILIIKTSSLGDIIQTLPLLSALLSRFPRASIDWVVEEALASVVSSHPLIRKSIRFNIKDLRKNWYRFTAWRSLVDSLRNLRKERYDWVFDLQANTKSGLLTALSRGKIQVGFGARSVREWPNLLATHVRFDPPKQINIRLQHLGLVEQFLQEKWVGEPALETPFRVSVEEKETVEGLLRLSSREFKVMVCPGSKWINKQVPLETLIDFLKKLQKGRDPFFFLVSGGEEERVYCEAVCRALPQVSAPIHRLAIPVWQNLMGAMDLVIAVDSSALHLCGTTKTPSFSLFGPTNPEVFKPLGVRHFAYQGKCPYGKVFDKTCPVLRSCVTGACLRKLSGEAIYEAFSGWWGAFREG